MAHMSATDLMILSSMALVSLSLSREELANWRQLWRPSLGRGRSSGMATLYSLWK